MSYTERIYHFMWGYLCIVYLSICLNLALTFYINIHFINLSISIYVVSITQMDYSPHAFVCHRVQIQNAYIIYVALHLSRTPDILTATAIRHIHIFKSWVAIACMPCVVYFNNKTVKEMSATSPAHPHPYLRHAHKRSHKVSHTLT